jgi:hypothetical protein
MLTHELFRFIPRSPRHEAEVDMDNLATLLGSAVTLREEHRLRVFENRVLRRIFGPKRDEVTGEWRKLHSEELRDLYSSPSIIRMRWSVHVA